MKTPKLIRIRLANEILTLVAVIISVGMIYYLTTEFLPTLRWDLTTSGQYSLSESTLRLLERIKKEDAKVNVYFFTRRTPDPTENIKISRVMDLLNEYHLRSDKAIARPKVVNPDQDPTEVKRLGVRYVGSVVLELTDGKGGDASLKRQVIAPRDIWTIRMIEGRPGPQEFTGENALSSALKRLMEGQTKNLYYLEGHGEHGMREKEPLGYSELTVALEEINLSLSPLNLIHTKSVPNNAQVLFIGGPQKTILPQEAQLITDYAKRGGSLLILVEFGIDPGLSPLFEFLGVEVSDDLVIEPRRSFQGNQVAPVPDYGDHEMLKDLRDSGEHMLLGTVRTIERALGDTRGVKTYDLLKTSEEAWGEKQYRVKGEPKFNAKEGDLMGPVTLAMAAVRNVEVAGQTNEMRAIVVGDANFATNDLIRFGVNRDFLLSAVHWLARGEEGLGISAKDPQFNFVTVTNRQVWVIFFIVVLMLPSLVLSLGVYRWWQRRAL